MIRVLICDDQDLVCEGLRVILSGEADISVVGVARDGVEAIEMVPACKPDVVLMDLKMPLMNGVHATREIKRRHSDVRVLVLTTYDSDDWVFDAIRSGASGYLLKDSPRRRLVDAIRETAAGKTAVDSLVAGKLFNHVAHTTAAPPSAAVDSLSEREREVLRLLGKGLSNSDIAARIYLSEGTVRNYVSSIFEKLGLEDRTQAAIFAIRYGLTDPGEK